jgi:tetratricopeptide (TPR) repeat protein
MKRFLTGTIVLVVSLCLSGGLLGQEKILDSTIRLTDPMKPDPRIQVAGDLQSKLAMARQLMQARNWQGAMAVMEIVYEDNPDNVIVQNQLLRCYQELQYYDKAETLARRRIEQYPGNVSYHLSLAEILARQGRHEESSASYRDALNLIDTFDENRYLMVIQSMINHGLDSSAVALVDTVRNRSGNLTLFALERGSVLEAQRKYGDAAREFIPLLAEDTTRQAHSAERRLLALLSFSESAEAVEQVLLDEALASNSIRTLRLLTSHYLRADRFDDAFQFALKQDSLDEHEGRALVSYIRQCRDNKAYAQVVRMSEYILANYPEHPMQAEVRIEYAQGLAGVGRPHEAIATYRQVLVAYPTGRRASEVLYAIGSIYYEQLNDYESALTSFDSVTSLPMRGLTYLQARKGIPYCHLRAGRLDQAREGFTSMQGLNLSEEIAEEIDFNIALVEFYQKQYDTAEAGFRKLIVDYPRGYYVNDALQLVLLVGEAEGAEDLLYDFSNAHLFEQRLMFDSAGARYLALVDNDNKALADVALFQLSEMEFDRADSADAMKYIDRLIDEFPDSYYQPFGIKIKADVYLLDDETREQAKELYAYLLENHPNYPFISDVRSKLREMEVDPKIG